MRYFMHPLAPLVLYSVVLTLCWSLSFATGRAAPTFELLAGYGWVWLTVFWIAADARRRRRVPCFDFGFLCIAFYPISLPWYCVWSRGWRGLLMLGLLACLWVLPILFAAVIATLFG